jgi:uncharacterized protein
MPMIREAIVTTIDAAGQVHVAPFGLIESGEFWVIAPFRPSKTLDNLTSTPFAVVSFTDDVRIFAGCLTGRKQWPLVPVAGFAVPRLAHALAHAELAVEKTEDDPQRPRFFCRIQKIEEHAPFRGLNRAKAAVLELCILVSRLAMLPREQVERDMAYLRIAIDKTAGPDEQEAWRWLTEKVADFYAKDGDTRTSG